MKLRRGVQNEKLTKWINIWKKEKQFKFIACKYGLSQVLDKTLTTFEIYDGANTCLNIDI